MKKLLALFLSLGMACTLSVGVVGCNKDKVKTAEEKKKEKDAEDKKAADAKLAGKKTALDVSLDKDAVKVEPGSKKHVEITVTKEKDAKDVHFVIEVDPSGKGVTATVDPVKMGDKKVADLKIEATDKASGEYTVTVSAKADGSTTVDKKVKVTVEKKVVAVEKDMKLAISGPESVKIKQGKDGTAKATVTMGADLKEAKVSAELKDKDGKDVKGTKVAVDPAKLAKTGDATVTVTVDDTAAEGEYTLTITAAGTDATPASATAKVAVTVQKK